MRRFGLAAFVLCTCLAGTSVAPAERQSGLPPLAALLDRMRRVATLYRDRALKFECTEAIQYRAVREDRSPPTGYVKLSYLYERDAEGRLQDCRMWKKSITNGSSLRCVDPFEYHVPMYLSNAYSWIFVFLE